MAKKAKPYHLEIQTHGKNPYGLLRSSYWENGKVRHDTLCRFTGLSIDQLRAMQAAIQGRVVAKEAFQVIASREYGASFACYEFMKTLGLPKVISSLPNEEWVRASLAMIVGRLVYAGSKLSLAHCGTYSALWEICGLDGDINVNAHCYDAMDKLFKRQGAIQKRLAKKHLQNGTVILYDITSCYVEGEYEDSELVDFGYNRDRKRGHEQIVISLLCSKEGCPVAVDVLRGNTKDETTVMDKIKELRTNYGLEKVIFVGDRGMVTQANYEKIDHETVKVISALTHARIKALCEKGTIRLEQFDEKNIVEVIDGGLRYGLCKNPDMAAKEAATRKALLKKTTDALDKIVAGTKQCKDSKQIRAGKVVGKYKMGKFIIFHGEGEGLTYTLDEAKIQQETSLDGCYIIYTDLAADELSVIETVKSYKNLLHVEQAFRNMKTVRLEIRPIFHKTDDRIRCHVFICMLAYYVMWHMTQRLRLLMDTDGKGAKRKYSFDYMLEILKSLRQETVDFSGAKSTIITAQSVEQRSILKLLGVKV
jgi:transposase